MAYMIGDCWTSVAERLRDTVSLHLQHQIPMILYFQYSGRGVRRFHDRCETTLSYFSNCIILLLSVFKRAATEGRKG